MLKLPALVRLMRQREILDAQTGHESYWVRSCGLSNTTLRCGGEDSSIREDSKLKIHHVVPSIREEASGPSYSVPALCSALARRGHRVVLHVLAPAPRLPDAPFELRAYPWAPLLRRKRRGRAGRAVWTTRWGLPRSCSLAIYISRAR